MSQRKRTFQLLLALFAAALLTAALAACERRGGETAGGAPAEKSYITVKGSDTMVHLVGTWAEEFMKLHKNKEVSVTGGGSGTGIAALLNGATDIAAASRKMKPEEFKLAEGKGLHPERTPVALDGIAVVVNPANPVSVLTLEQLGKIFTGAYANWRQVGGPDAGIVVLSRESSSGTYVFFQEHVLKKKDYTADARLMPATSAIIQAVSADKWAVGYVGLGYAVDARGKVKMLSVKENDDAPAVEPSEATVKSGEYSISRPLQLYTAGPPTGLVKEFIDYCLSPAGQKIVVETGYVKIN